MDGRALRFRLGALNNMNFLMYDEETGSWWQQISGECLFGKLKGRRLERIPSDEVALAIWRAEHPGSTAARFLEGIAYPRQDWDRRISRLPAIAGGRTDLAPRDLVAGVEWNGQSAAFPLDALRAGIVQHTVGGEPVLVAAADAGAASVRVFLRRLDGRVLDFYRRADAAEFSLLDETTGSQWDFSGRAVAGPLQGKQLQRVQNTKDYWFDWQRYHPGTAVYRR